MITFGVQNEKESQGQISNNPMKKAFKIIGWVLLGLVVLVLLAVTVLPIVFKPQILSFAKEQINKNIEADVDFKDLKLSLIKSFPDLYIALDGLEVVNRAPFEGDTLARLDRLAVAVNLRSLLDPANMEVKQILLQRPWVNGIKDNAGHVNWSIAKQDTAAVKEQDTAKSEPMNIGVKLRSLRIEDGVVSYLDRQTKMLAELDNLDLDLKGDLGLSRTDLSLELLIEKVFFSQAGIVYAPGLTLGFDADVDADLDHKVFVLKDNSLRINALELLFEGSVALPTDSVVLDMAFSTPNTSFKTLLSLIPAIYSKSFSSIETRGELALQGSIKGVMHGKENPDAQVALQVKDAMFKYPTLPESVENINIDLQAFYNGKQMDASRLDLNRLAFTMAKNPFQMHAKLRTPVSDPNVEAVLKGKIDLGSVKRVVPLDSMELNGLLELDVALAALKSKVEAKAFEQCKLDGVVKISDVSLQGVLKPHTVKVDALELHFNPKIVTMPDCRVKVANSDVALSGKVSNFLPYLLADGTLAAQLELKSNLVDLNTLFPQLNAPKAEGSDTVKKVEEAADTTATDLSIAKRLNVLFRSRIERLLFQKLDIAEAVGNIRLANECLTLEELSCKALDGTMKVDGVFDFKNRNVPNLTAKADLQRIDIAKSVEAFTSVEKLISTAKYMEGNVSVKIDMKSELDRHFSPVLSTLSANGEVAISSLSIVNAPLLTNLGQFLNNDFVTRPTLEAQRVKFSVHDGKLYFPEVKWNMRDVPATIGGSVSLDKSMDLKMNMEMPLHLIPKATDVISKAQSYLPAGVKLANSIPVELGIGGTVTDPKFSLHFDENLKGSLKDAARATVEQKVEEVKQVVREKVGEAAEKVMAEARAQVDRIKAEADRLAEKAIEEANTQANRLIEEASSKGFIAQAAAKKAAEAVRQKGEEAADRIRREAQQKCDELLAKAQQQADALK